VSWSSSFVRHTPRRRASSLALLGALMTVLAAPAGVHAAAAPRLSTPYPAVSVAPGAKVSFELTVSAATEQAVRLTVGRLPDGWKSVLRGGGYEVTAVTAGPGSAAGKATLEVDVPADAAPTRAAFSVDASSPAGSDTLHLEIEVNAAAGGQVTLASDFPSLSGASGTTFTYTLTLTNETPQDRTFAVAAAGPDGWQVGARPSGDAQAASLPIKAGSSATISVTATPPDTVPAGTYPISVKATEGGQEIDAQLSAEVIGQYKLSLSTPDGRLNAQGTAGGPIELQLVLRNTGTAPLQSVKLTSTPPSGWKVDFTPSATLDGLAPQTSQTVTARMTPSDQAIAGDYVVTFTASTSQATSSQDIRVTVETSLTWAIVGVGLIVLTFLGLGWVFRRFGRR